MAKSLLRWLTNEYQDHTFKEKKTKKTKKKKIRRGEAEGEGYLQEIVTKSQTEHEHDGHKEALLPRVTQESG